MKQAIVLLCLIVAVTAYSQMPRTLNYQGTLATGSTAVPDGDYTVTFRLYTASSGGSAVWIEPQSVRTRNGVFSAILGKSVPLPASFNTSYWMSLQVGTDPELSPRLEMTGVSYSMQTLVADSTVKLADNSVTSGKIVDGSVTGADVGQATITAGNIFDEPGVSSSSGWSVEFKLGNIVYNADSVDITLPAPGYVVVVTTGFLQLVHASGEYSAVMVGIAPDRTTMNLSVPGMAYARINGALPTETYQIPFSTTRVFHETSSGTKRYYFNAYYNIGPNNSSSVFTSLTTAMYFPTLRGTLSKPSDVAPPPDVKLAPDGTALRNR